MAGAALTRALRTAERARDAEHQLRALWCLIVYRTYISDQRKALELTERFRTIATVDGYFRKYADIPTPITLGHEITGVVHKLGSIVSKSSGFREGDHVVVVAGWPDGETALAVMKF